MLLQVVEYSSLSKVTAETVRVQATLIDPTSGEEKLVDIQCRSDHSKHVIPAIRQKYGNVWDIFEWFVQDTPF